MKHSTLIVVVFGCLLLSAVAIRSKSQSQLNADSNSSSNSNNLVAQLLNAATEVDRIKLLDKDSDFVFDFVNPPTNKTTSSGKAGKIVVANRASFPALVGTGIAMGLGFIQPCGMNTPHTHPRATELFFAVNGTFQTGFIQENGARQVNNTVEPGQMTVFPMGSIHWQANLGCEQVTFVAGLSNEDPGTSQIAQNFFGIDEGILSAALGGKDKESLQSTLKGIPANVALGLEECQRKCGLGSYANESKKNSGGSSYSGSSSSGNSGSRENSGSGYSGGY